ncbi:MAG: hypothetical protein H0U57_07245 [Tatlockia sp.]|nr:hypothetical protein [Tatlockia sp.]
MKEHFEIVEQQPIKEIWWQIISTIIPKTPYFTLNKFFLNLLQEMVILELKKALESPDLNFAIRIRASYQLAKPTRQVLSIMDLTLDELLKRKFNSNGSFHHQAQSHFLAALAPITTSSQSKKIIESLLEPLENINIQNFPGSLGNLTNFWNKGKRQGLYNILWEHGKNLNWKDANLLANKCFNSIEKIPGKTSLQLLSLCAFGNKIDKKLQEPASEEIVSLLWSDLNSRQGFNENNCGWLIDLSIFIDTNQAFKFMVELIENIPTRMQKIKNYYNPGRGNLSGANVEFFALGLFFKSFSKKLDSHQLDYCIGLLETVINLEKFDSNVELGLEFLCSLTHFPSSCALKIINLSLQYMNDPESYQPEWVALNENNFHKRLLNYFSKAVRNIDHALIEKIILTEILQKSSLAKYHYMKDFLKILLTGIQPSRREDFFKEILDFVEPLPDEDERKKAVLLCCSEEDKKTENFDIQIFLKHKSSPFPENEYFREKFELLNLEQRVQVITTMYATTSFDDKDESITKPRIESMLEILGFNGDGDRPFKIRHEAFKVVVMLINLNRITFDLYPLLLAAGKQSDEQLMIAVILKLHLRFSDLKGYFFCLNQDYLLCKNKEKNVSFYSALTPESPKIAAYAHEEVIAILKTFANNDERKDFLKQISSFSIFEQYDNYQFHQLGDDCLELLLELGEREQTQTFCTIS